MENFKKLVSVPKIQCYNPHELIRVHFEFLQTILKISFSKNDIFGIGNKANLLQIKHLLIMSIS